jgi:hypothetical protein
MSRIGQANEKYAMDMAKEMEQRFRDGTLNYHYLPHIASSLLPLHSLYLFHEPLHNQIVSFETSLLSLHNKPFYTQIVSSKPALSPHISSIPDLTMKLDIPFS